MKHIRSNEHAATANRRRGSTLLIVLALLSILAFLGMVFFTISSQERAAADFFSEAAKVEVVDPDDPFPFGLRQVLVGPNNRERSSIIHSHEARHAMLTSMVGSDLAPFTGRGVNIAYDGAGLPVIDQDYDDTDDAPTNQWQNPLNFVDSFAAWGTAGVWAGGSVNEGQLRQARSLFPAPDVPYTYPDINNLFLAYRGWAIRDNDKAGSTITDSTLKYERVPVFIPSFFRPALLKSSNVNGQGGVNALTDFDWYEETVHPEFSVRSMRPNALHVAGFTGAGAPILRFLDARNPAHAPIIASLPGGSGAFPLRPGESGNSVNFGRLGVWTSDPLIDPSAPLPAIDAGIQNQFADTFELDSDNDDDGIKEGIWMDLSYPVEVTAGGNTYTTLFSFTVYDLDGLHDLNVHGNIANADRTTDVPSLVGAGNPLATTNMSASNLGLSPTEISPVRALFPTGAGPDAEVAGEFTDWYGATPSNRREQANMELMWLLTGRIETDSAPHDGAVHVGKWGDAAALWYHKNGGGGELISTLPRPGRSGNLAQASGSAISFGGQLGFDDNRDLDEGIATTENGRIRGFVHPLDVSGRGFLIAGTDPRVPNLYSDDATRPSRWLRYTNYSLTGTPGALFNDSTYIRGIDGDFAAAADNLVTAAAFNYALDDPTEVIFENELTLRPDDAIFGAGDMVPAHLSSSDSTNAVTSLSTRLSDIAPYAFSGASTIKERFTTLTNSLRYLSFPHQLGANNVSDSGGGDDGPRWWEWTADSDADGKPEFPPQFGGIAPYSPTDPFRAVVRRLLTTEVGDRSNLLGQLPLSLNHILDVNRTSETPPETSAQFLPFLRRSGMKFRSLTEHPDAEEADGSSNRAAAITAVPVSGTAAGDTARRNFPPRTFGDREFWARRDRQQMARDIYVLLYTLGGAEISGGTLVDYRGDNGGRAVYNNAQLRRMAQFAVNLVDSMDTDNVITKFEYDKNLNNGWDLDDDAYTDDGFGPATAPTAPEPLETSDTGNGLYPEDSATERGVVYGVEAQQLALSEALAVYSEEVAPSADLAETEYNDETAHRVLLHLELQNMQPYPVKMSDTEVGTTNNEFALWRMLRIDRETASDTPQDDAPNFEFSIMDGNADVTGGGLFTVAIAGLEGTPADPNPVGFGTADLYVDDDSDGNFNLVSPDIGLQTTTIATGATPVPSCDLDSVHTTHDTRYLANGVSDGGEFLQGIVADATAGTLTEYHGNDAYEFPAATPVTDGGFEIVLQRRQNPNLPRVPLSENPFIEVDRMTVNLRPLLDTATATPTVQLSELRSNERAEPLNALTIDAGSHEAISATNWRRNSIGALMNDATDRTPLDGVGVFQRWQTHFDRDYASPAELLNLPVVPQKLLTFRLDRMRYAAAQQVHQNFTVSATPPHAGDTQWISSAEAMFLQPEFPDVDPALTENDNRWYRLLQFVEVPSRLNKMLGNYLNLKRTPGKININGLRHVEVYAGLIDNEVFAQIPNNRDPNNASPFDQDNRYAPFVRDTTPGTASSAVANIPPPGPGGFAFRDRYFEFCQERDGAVTSFDPQAGADTDFWIPGTPSARPFQPFSFSAPDITLLPDDNGIERTIFRRFGTETTNTTEDQNRNWLEVGDTAFHQDPDGTSVTNANTMQRHQLMSKLLNNTTTTSNAFIIYATAAYFETHEDAATGVVQVGGRIDLDGDSLTAGVSDDISTGWEQRAVFVIDRTEAYNAFDPASGSFDWQRLVRYRADLSPTAK